MSPDPRWPKSLRPAHTSPPLPDTKQTVVSEFTESAKDMLVTGPAGASSWTVPASISAWNGATSGEATDLFPSDPSHPKLCTAEALHSAKW